MPDDWLLGLEGNRRLVWKLDFPKAAGLAGSRSWLVAAPVEPRWLMLRHMAMWHPVRLSVLAVVLTGCGGGTAELASSGDRRTPTPCIERVAINTYSDDTATTHDTLELAAVAYHRYAEQFDFPIAVPAGGYIVRTSDSGKQALLPSGDIEMTAAMDKGGWRITEVRECQQ